MKNFEINCNVPLMLSIKETAEKYSLSQHYVRTLLLSGQVKGVRIGRGKLLCNCNDLERFFAESYVNAPAPAQVTGIRPIPTKL
jgi:hypothetical protein